MSVVRLWNVDSIVATRNSISCQSSSHHYHSTFYFPICSSNSAASTFYAASAASAASAAGRSAASCRSPSLALFSGMNNSSSSLFPLRHCKILHLIRHAQGIHNVEGEDDYGAYLSQELFDAHLTSLGWDQVDNLRKHVIARGLSKKIDLVITSPLLRTIQTAVGVFGGEVIADGVRGQPLMVENAGNSGRPAISSLDGLPIIAVEACREHLGVHPCDKRRTISEYQTLFPAVDFSLIESNEDILWKPDVREANEEVAVRGTNFINWLWTRKETEIAVVTHSGFLYHTLQRIGKEFHPVIKHEICKHFANCELRSMIVVDKSLVGLGANCVGSPGMILQGTDPPSETADDN